MQNIISSAAAAVRPQQTLDFGDAPFGNEVTLTPDVDSLLQRNCVVAIGV